jgi:hypothetical protein
MKPASSWWRFFHIFKPYTFEDFINEYKPKDHKELEDVERRWFRNLEASSRFSKMQ